MNKKSIKSRFKTDRQSPLRTVCGSEFQADGAENRKTRLEKSVLVNVRPAARWQMNVMFGCRHVPKSHYIQSLVQT